jgi:transglutaminase/protease-like cytokinesis protein 3
LNQLAERLAWIDDHARSAPVTATRSVSTLAAYLTGPVTSDLLKARALFTWLAYNIRYDAAGFRAGSCGPQSAEAVLAQRTSVCAGYANLFLALAQACRLDAVVVSGWGKGADYGVGETTLAQPNHAWNAVRVDGQWRLLDATWGAGYLSPAGAFERAFNPHYFLTAPELFLYDHLPEDSRWQLLDTPISPQQFLDTVQISPAFFRYDLRLNETRARIVIPNSLMLSLQAPADVVMMAQIQRNGAELDSAFTFTQREGTAIVTRATFPQAGRYTLVLFAKWRHEEPYTSVATYAVEATVATSGLPGFPRVFDGFDRNAVRLYAPLTGNLAAGTPHLFKLDVPGATEVSVYTGGVPVRLSGAGSLFVGDVSLRAGEVQVAVRRPELGNSSDVVLAYTAK